MPISRPKLATESQKGRKKCNMAQQMDDNSDNAALAQEKDAAEDVVEDEEEDEEELEEPPSEKDKWQAKDATIVDEKVTERANFGFLPLLAGCSDGQIGALNAESFAERIISGANQAMDEGNTLLADKTLEMLVVLRMNRAFMLFRAPIYAGTNRAMRLRFF
jgi:hypothetical protein